MDSTNKSQESILLSALRSFLKSFSSAMGIFVFILLLVVVFASQILQIGALKQFFLLHQIAAVIEFLLV